MTTKRLSHEQRGRIAEKMMDWGNLVFAGLVVAQAFSRGGFNIVLAAVGVLAFAGAYFMAITYMRGGDRS